MGTSSRLGGAPLGIKIGGTASVYCLHGREQYQITEEAQVMALAPPDAVIDGKQHKLLECSCCHNLFVSDDGTDTKCLPCDPARQRLLNAVGGDIILPRGVSA